MADDTLIEGPCEDCGKVVSVWWRTYRRGSAVRDPQTHVCQPCSATRLRLTDVIRDMPGDMEGIKRNKAKIQQRIEAAHGGPKARQEMFR